MSQDQNELQKKRGEEKLRKIKEQMELKRKRREEEERRRKQLEEEARIKAEMEAERRRAEEEEMKRRELEKAKQKEIEEQLRKEEEEAKSRQAALEQERLDHELALRLAKESNSNVEPMEEQKAIIRAASLKDPNKKYDLSKWKYAELRDTINTSCDVELLEACKQEFHRRLKVYHQWKNKNKDRTASHASVSKPTSRLPPRRPQRYFRVPFVKPGDEYRDNDFKKRGYWFAHFDGQWIARQLEIHPNGVNVVLVAGTDDLDMCELSLDETGLTRKRGAEITKREFEFSWQKCGGKSDAYKQPTFE
ncbi:unconventional myosin-VI-like [Dendronephthya gigantea]|uniref:unconventional myosin-VI-like n=1 Tax=Dendronephthya gigantea TaxID=151771 RepID=UPI001068F78C|nr:unconventional myosin-VI-like [Dendronephthya gigantea]